MLVFISELATNGWTQSQLLLTLWWCNIKKRLLLTDTVGALY